METIGKLMGGKVGWERVAVAMDAQLERGLCFPKDWENYLLGRPYNLHNDRGWPLKDKHGALVVYQDPPLMESWVYFEKWRREHPDQQVPLSVKRLRSNDRHRAWLAAGCPELSAHDEFMTVHKGICEAHPPCGVQYGKEAEPILPHGEA